MWERSDVRSRLGSRCISSIFPSFSDGASIRDGARYIWMHSQKKMAIVRPARSRAALGSAILVFCIICAQASAVRLAQ